LKQLERSRRIPANARSGLEHGTEAGAPFADATDTRAIEQLGSVRLVAEDVLSLSQFRRELGACRDVAGVARAAQLFGFSISGSAG